MTPGPVSLAVLLMAAGLAACSETNEPRTPIPTTGTLRITTSTGGVDPDPDGYALFIDTLPQVPIGSNTSQQLVTVTPGTYQVLLDGIAANCVLAVPAPVEVLAGMVVDVALNVNCTPILVDLRVTVQSTGEDIDPSGYVVTVDSQLTLPVAGNGQVVIRAPNGSRQIGLAERASNCSITSGPPGNVDLPIGTTTDVRFALDCVHTPKLAIVVTSGTYSINPDGTGFSRVGPGIFPEWSPDGQRVVTLFRNQVYMMNADTTGAHEIYTGGLRAVHVAWAPDGTHLAVALRVAPDTVSLFVCDTNGSNLTRITTGGFDNEPAWSPDGNRIAFTRGFTNGELWLANADGSGVTQIPNGQGRLSQWSPDGSRLLFIGPGAEFDQRATFINPDGSNRVLVQPQLTGRFDVFDAIARWARNGSGVAIGSANRIYEVDVATGGEMASVAVEGTMLAWRN